MKSVLSIIVVCAITVTGCAGSVKKEKASAKEIGRQGDRDGETRDACLKAIRQARVDARNGAYRMYVFSQDRYDARFARFLGEYLKTRNGIELVVFGPGDRERSKCYSNEMDKIILNSFGPNVLGEAEQEARQLFDSRN